MPMSARSDPSSGSGRGTSHTDLQGGTERMDILEEWGNCVSGNLHGERKAGREYCGDAGSCSRNWGIDVYHAEEQKHQMNAAHIVLMVQRMSRGRTLKQKAPSDAGHLLSHVSEQVPGDAEDRELPVGVVVVLQVRARQLQGVFLAAALQHRDLASLRRKRRGMGYRILALKTIFKILNAA